MQRLATSWRTRRRTRLQSQVREDLLDHRRLQDRRDDLELADVYPVQVAAVGYRLPYDAENVKPRS